MSRASDIWGISTQVIHNVFKARDTWCNITHNVAGNGAHHAAPFICSLIIVFQHENVFTNIPGERYPRKGKGQMLNVCRKSTVPSPSQNESCSKKYAKKDIEKKGNFKNDNHIKDMD